MRACPHRRPVAALCSRTGADYQPQMAALGAAMQSWSDEVQLREREVALMERLLSARQLAQAEGGGEGSGGRGTATIDAELSGVRRQLGGRADPWITTPAFQAGPPRRSSAAAPPALKPLSSLPPASAASRRGKTTSKGAAFDAVANYFANREDSTLLESSVTVDQRAAIPTFEAIDMDGDGAISREEYTQRVETAAHSGKVRPRSEAASGASMQPHIGHTHKRRRPLMCRSSHASARSTRMGTASSLARSTRKRPV